MTGIAIALLQLPDSRIVLQRRDDNAPTSPGKLGFFGGHIEKNESPHEAIRRELKEETSLDVSSLNFKYLESFKMILDTKGGREAREYHLYEVLIKDDTFKVYEGVRSETYDLQGALERKDLTQSVSKVLKRL